MSLIIEKFILGLKYLNKLDYITDVSHVNNTSATTNMVQCSVYFTPFQFLNAIGYWKTLVPEKKHDL